MEPIRDFYEDDEPVEKIMEAFERGKKELTGPRRGQTEYLHVPGLATGLAPESSNEPYGETVSR